eukprot:scaffold520_cov708-Prasinococcus_capsulatus_cf.AAC.1
MAASESRGGAGLLWGTAAACAGSGGAASPARRTSAVGMLRTNVAHTNGEATYSAPPFCGRELWAQTQASASRPWWGCTAPTPLLCRLSTSCGLAMPPPAHAPHCTLTAWMPRAP